ncbi:hypothetical protein HD806DRAFT_528494 [Xylariaceae sp. AK1471]|nr:hypothetical protein HD806DRAFT_528494 [Xylariaceae sp. AK1471]
MAETDSSIPAQRPASQTTAPPSKFPLPRITIRFCTQCKWMLRAAYFAQELLSTFSTSLGEVALQPTTGGIFIVEIFHNEPSSEAAGSSGPISTATTTDPHPTIQQRVLWDRKIDGGFPETKELKRRVRDVIEPGRNLGHVDRDYPKPQQQRQLEAEVEAETQGEPNIPRKSAMPESEQQQQQRQPPGQRWPQLSSGSSQPGTPGQQNITNPQSQLSTNTDTQTSSQSKIPKDLRLHPQHGKSTVADGLVYDPRMPGGGIKPVMPPVALSSRYTIQESPSPPQPQSQSQKSQEECEDCQ